MADPPTSAAYGKGDVPSSGILATGLPGLFTTGGLPTCCVSSCRRTKTATEPEEECTESFDAHVLAFSDVPCNFRPAKLSCETKGHFCQAWLIHTRFKTGVSLQVKSNNTWEELTPVEFKQVGNHLAGGELRFTLVRSGVPYIVDFSNEQQPWLEDLRSGSKLPLRIVDPKTPEDIVAKRRKVLPPGFTEIQKKFGPQSKRGKAAQEQLSVLSGCPHCMSCFEILARNEEKFCGEWAVFYHSYSCAALLYELQAAMASVLFQFPSHLAPLPRFLLHEFAGIEDASQLVAKFEVEFEGKNQDHDPAYRRVAISAMCSLVALGPEASTPVIFMHGYSEKDVPFREVLDILLESWQVPKNKSKQFKAEILEVCSRHGLDASPFGGSPCASGRAGHLLQIFVRREIVNEVAYAAQPYGAVDTERDPLSAWLDTDANTNFGQARLLAHPKWFMQAGAVRMHVVSADPTFHDQRKIFQEELVELLGRILADRAHAAAMHILRGPGMSY